MSKNKWPGPGKPEDLAGQSIGKDPIPLYATPDGPALHPQGSAVFSKEHIGQCYRVYRNRDGKLVEHWCNYDDPRPDDAEAADGKFVVIRVTNTTET